jgi:hypothetical protein
MMLSLLKCVGRYPASLEQRSAERVGKCGLDTPFHESERTTTVVKFVLRSIIGFLGQLKASRLFSISFGAAAVLAD